MRYVLIVDDDPIIRAAIEIYLERHGFEVTIADGGEAGLRALEDSGFDLLLVDILHAAYARLLNLIRIFHERAPTVPLIDMFGYALANLDSPVPDFPRMELWFGAARCLRKPLTPGALLEAVAECLTGRPVTLHRRRPVELAARGDSSSRPRWIVRRVRCALTGALLSAPVSRLAGACIGKTLFTIDHIDEGFLGRFRNCTDRSR